MKKFLLGSVALAAVIAGPAMAADMPLKAPPPIVVYTWTGCYVGAHVGGKSSRATTTTSTNFVGIPVGLPVTDPIYMSGALGGGQIGCNYQFAGGWLIGVEVDGSAVQSDGQGTALPPLNPLFNVQVTEHWVATARGKLGYAWDKWMLYVTGGGAWAGVELVNDPRAFVPAGQLLGASQTQTLSGWTVGLGAEYALGYGWSIKGEYLYMDFSEKGYFSPSTPAVAGEERLHLRQSVARFGMNYKFDWGGPVVARY
jgi:outer membrane immunogenic protein